MIKHNTQYDTEKRNVLTLMIRKALQTLEKDVYGLTILSIATQMSAEGQGGGMITGRLTATVETDLQLSNDFGSTETFPATDAV